MTNLNYQQTHFVRIEHDIRHLPSDTGIEVAFACRFNSGKSNAVNTQNNEKNQRLTPTDTGSTHSINML
ncbi:YihA family ribosome biogenesis GTP-binding protein, partial [Escherichia coli]|nr:YihA family ribosome biogenesis GTP-binding protein [Escherichia coli]